jgi:hypothetical protein
LRLVSQCQLIQIKSKVRPTSAHLATRVQHCKSRTVSTRHHDPRPRTPGLVRDTMAVCSGLRPPH